MKRGLIVMADLDPVIGREQRGRRPCIVVSNSDIAAHQRFDLLVIVPMTSTPLAGPIYPAIEPEPGTGLSVRSFALVDQIRVLDKSRIRGQARRPLSPPSMRAVDAALRLVLGLG